jgi:hypothetical protein
MIVVIVTPAHLVYGGDVVHHGEPDLVPAGLALTR